MFKLNSDGPPFWKTRHSNLETPAIYVTFYFIINRIDVFFFLYLIKASINLENWAQFVGTIIIKQLVEMDGVKLGQV